MSRFREHVWYNMRELPLIVWRDASVQHFDTASGDYIWPPRSKQCVPFREVVLDDWNQLQTWNPWLQVCDNTPLPFPARIVLREGKQNDCESLCVCLPARLWRRGAGATSWPILAWWTCRRP
jgi:hypothetical protein